MDQPRELPANTWRDAGELWLTSGPASILAEEVPAGLITGDALLQPPPKPISALTLLPDALPEAWGSETTSALAVSVALAKRLGKSLPWTTVREAIYGAIRARLLERAIDSGSRPCDFAGAQMVKLRVPSVEPTPRPEPPALKPGVRTAEAELDTSEIQDLADSIAAVKSAATAAGCNIRFRLAVEISGKESLSEVAVKKINAILSGVSPKLRLR